LRSAIGRGNAGLDEVQEDPSDLGGIGDDGKHLHGGAAAAAAIPRGPAYQPGLSNPMPPTGEQGIVDEPDRCIVRRIGPLDVQEYGLL
jgi:hypothetical protein